MIKVKISWAGHQGSHKNRIKYDFIKSTRSKSKNEFLSQKKQQQQHFHILCTRFHKMRKKYFALNKFRFNGLKLKKRKVKK